MNIIGKDAILIICEHLSFKDLLNITSTCKEFFSIRGDIKYIKIIYPT